MKSPESNPAAGARPMSRRSLFNILPAGIAGCLGCAGSVCAQQPDPPAGHSWTEKADLTWEQIFRFAFQKDLIPLLKNLSQQIGPDRFVAMLKQSTDAVVQKKSPSGPPRIRDLTTFATLIKAMPPLMQHALEVEVVEQTPQAFEYRVKKCLWAKCFRDEQAGDIGYAMVCYPDYAVAKSLNPKLTLLRSKTLMQGDDFCGLRYVMEG